MNATMVAMKTGSQLLSPKLVLLFLLLIILSSCTFLKTPEIKGVVVDAETGKPIEGARVYASWHRIIAGPGGTTNGAILKELRMRTKADGSFELPGYLLVNIVPFPFGQGGNFGFIVYDHGYEVKRYSFWKRSDFTKAKYNEFDEVSKQINISMKKITDAEEYYFQLGSSPSIVGDEYLIEEMRYFLNNFHESRWRTDVQRQIDRMKK